MPERMDPRKTLKMDAKALSSLKFKVRPELVTDLNIVLSKEHIDSILKELMSAQNGLPGGAVSIWGGHCCVDASVGSSVAGPFSSVGSSVSCDPNIGAGSDIRAIHTKVNEKLTAEKIKVNVTVPKNITIK